MNVQRRILHQALPAQNPTAEIHHQEIARLHLGPMHAEGREQKSVRIPRHQERQMIVDALVQTEAIRQPIARREIDSGGSLSLWRCLDGLETRIHISCLAVCRDGFPSIATPTTVLHTPVATIFW